MGLDWSCITGTNPSSPTGCASCAGGVSGTDGHALVILVPRDDYEGMIALYLATKAWVLKSRTAGRR